MYHLEQEETDPPGPKVLLESLHPLGVIPAKAGTQDNQTLILNFATFLCPPAHHLPIASWVPAFVGMTLRERIVLSTNTKAYYLNFNKPIKKHSHVL
jgi:hypothetical protein